MLLLPSSPCGRPECTARSIPLQSAGGRHHSSVLQHPGAQSGQCVEVIAGHTAVCLATADIHLPLANLLNLLSAQATGRCVRAQHRDLRARAATLERETVAVPFQQEAGKGLGFYTGQDGYLYCDNLRVEDARKQVSHQSCLHCLPA